MSSFARLLANDSPTGHKRRWPNDRVYIRQVAAQPSPSGRGCNSQVAAGATAKWPKDDRGRSDGVRGHLGAAAAVKWLLVREPVGRLLARCFVGPEIATGAPKDARQTNV